MDLSHGASFYPAARVRPASVEEMVDADRVVMSAGRGGGAAESRLALLRDNATIVRRIAGRLAGSRGILVVVTNPVDIMTRVAAEASGLPPARVIGTGTMLDTARLRHSCSLCPTRPRSPSARRRRCTSGAAAGRFSPAEVPFRRSTMKGRRSRRDKRTTPTSFPGVGLGVSASGARRVTDDMFFAAARTLASEVSEADLARGGLFPPLRRIREISASIATAVARFAYEKDLATVPRPDDLRGFIEAQMYDPNYQSYA